ncbi:MAG: FISUMP domain-containing protein, partial [Bacteroidales bacterium]
TIDSTSIHPDCPYNNVNFDLLACSKRTGGANNWEGFMVDHRDCKIYRMVAMPELSTYNKGQGRWWLAQNLNYTKNLIMNTRGDAGVGVIGTYWCPNSPFFNGQGVPINWNAMITQTSGTEISCNTYGAWYEYATAMSRNGLAPTQDANTAETVTSSAQGICPKGWVVPGRRDMAVMFNKAANCSDQLATTTVNPESTDAAPCNHFSKGALGTGHNYRTTIVPNQLRSTLSSHRTLNQDSAFVTATNPRWAWHGVGSKRQHGARATDYFGFSLLPAGYISGPSCTLVGAYTFIRTSSIEYWQFFHGPGDHRQVGNITDRISLRCVRRYTLDE